MLHSVSRLVVSGALLTFISVGVHAAPPSHANNERAFDRLKAEAKGAEISVNSATGTASFVRIPPGQAAKVKSGSIDAEAVSFIRRHAPAFGLRVGSTDLKLEKKELDSLGHTHVSFGQEYGGIPVFGASLSAHFDADDQLRVVTGTLVPDLSISTAPAITVADAGMTAVNWVESNGTAADLSVGGSRLLIFREGLAKGVPGDNHLAYEIEVGNGVHVREFVYIDAHTGKFIDQISGIKDGLYRRAYDGMGGSFGDVLGIWPASPESAPRIT